MSEHTADLKAALGEFVAAVVPAIDRLSGVMARLENSLGIPKGHLIEELDNVEVTFRAGDVGPPYWPAPTPAIVAPAAAASISEPASASPVRPPALSAGQVKFTDERILLMTTLRARGATWVDIHEAVAALPGPALASADATCMKWHNLQKAGRLPNVSGVESLPAQATRLAVPSAPAPVIVDLVLPPPNVKPPTRYVMAAETLQPALRAAATTTIPLNAEEMRRADQRRARLKVMWQSGASADEIMIALNRMPGPIITAKEVVRKAAACGFVRPAVGEPEAYKTGGPASLEVIKSWFRTGGGDPDVIPAQARLLTAVNALRRLMMLPPFEVA